MSFEYILIHNGTIVNHDKSFKSDILTHNDKIKLIGENLMSNDEVKQLISQNKVQIIDATDKHVIPAGIDPHTHMNMPFMGQVTCDDFDSGTKAAIAGGTGTIIDFVIPDKSESLREGFDKWCSWAGKARCDYAFHMAITRWNAATEAEMKQCVDDMGITSFKYFSAYKGALMLEPHHLSSSFEVAQRLGTVVANHCEVGDLVSEGQEECLSKGITDPVGHPLSRMPHVEAIATQAIVDLSLEYNVPAYIVHCSCEGALNAVIEGQKKNAPVLAEALAGHLCIDDSAYQHEDYDIAAAHVMSPPFRQPCHQEALWKGIQRGHIRTTATDHCAFTKAQKRMGQGNFTKIPNGCAGVEERLAVVFNKGVNGGLIDFNTFVSITSSNAAKIFGMYPNKGYIGTGSQADIVLWDSNKEHVISAETHHSNIDINVFENTQCKGKCVTTILRGKVAYDGETVVAESGQGQYVRREPFCEYAYGVGMQQLKGEL